LKGLDAEVWSESKKYHTEFENFNLQNASNYVWDIIGEIDAKIAETEPFKLVKTDPEKAKEIIRELVTKVWKVSSLLIPFMPQTSEQIREAVLKGEKPEPLFKRI
jgi:methionyl-tRNA synthetase